MVFHQTCRPAPDKFGRPVYIELVGRTDVDRLSRAITPERLVRYHVWTWERCVRRYLPACSAAAGRPIVTTTNIIDCKGLRLAQLNRITYKVLRLFSKIDQVRGRGCGARSGCEYRYAAAGCGVWLADCQWVLRMGLRIWGKGRWQGQVRTEAVQEQGLVARARAWAWGGYTQVHVEGGAGHEGGVLCAWAAKCLFVAEFVVRCHAPWWNAGTGVHCPGG